MKKTLPIVSQKGEVFIWVHGCYDIKEINKENYIVYTGGLSIYQPKFKRIVEELASLNTDDDSVLRFIKKYGPLGIYQYFIHQKTYDIYASWEWLKQNREVDEDPPKNVLSRVWDEMFGIHELHMQKIINCPMLYGTNPTNENDILFWQTYREPLSLTKTAINDFKSAVRLLSKGQQHSKIKLTLEFDGQGIVCPVTSLIEGAYSYLVWNVNQGKKIRECIGRSKHKCQEVCNKSFFWPKDPRQVWGIIDCRVNRNYRSRARRTGERPQRSYKKRQDALKLYEQRMSLEDIAKAVKADVNVVHRWIVSGSKE